MKLLLVILGVVVALSSAADPNKLLLTVYYESKCPDSRRFIVDQLAPTINQLQEYVELQLVPFGKAKSITINNGEIVFECQHGQTECNGNMVQDCALNLMSGRPEPEKVNYVACEMQTLAGTTGNLQCVKKAHVPVKNVRNCLNSNQGVELQLISEKLTHDLRPKFIPSITINGQFDQQIQDQSQKNLLRTLCGLLPDAAPCTRHYNSNSLRALF